VIKGEREHHALIKITLGMGVGGSDGQTKIAHAFKEWGSGLSREGYWIASVYCYFDLIATSCNQ
jgi:hypothetical protein